MSLRLALDLGSTIGYCFFDDSKIIRSGIANIGRGNRVKGSRNPHGFIRLRTRLEKLIGAVDLDYVVFEETFGRGKGKFMLSGYEVVVMMWLIDNGLTWNRISPSGWKKDIFGRGNVSKFDYYKAAIKTWPDVTLKTDDEAAARWLATYALEAL